MKFVIKPKRCEFQSASANTRDHSSVYGCEIENNHKHVLHIIIFLWNHICMRIARKARFQGHSLLQFCDIFCVGATFGTLAIIINAHG